MKISNRTIIFVVIIGLLAISALIFYRNFNAPDGKDFTVIGGRERVKIVSTKGETEITAKIDTGADSTSIDINLVKSLDLSINKDKKKIVITSEGREERSTVNFDFILGTKRISTLATVEDRTGMSNQMIVGKNDLEGFLVDPTRQFIVSPNEDKSLFSPFLAIRDSIDRSGAKLLLVFPILSAIIVVLRLFLGIRTYGTFAPIVIAVSLIDLKIIPGDLIYSLLVIAGIGLKIFILDRFSLPRVAEFSLIIFSLAAIIFALPAIASGLSISFVSVFFPLIITSHLIEQAVRTIEEHGLGNAALVLFATMATATFAALAGILLFEQSHGTLWIIFAISIAMVVAAGKYTGLRISEFFRFKILRQKHVHD